MLRSLEGDYGNVYRNYVNVDLKEDTPIEVIKVLEAMCKGDMLSEYLVNKPRRWSYLFNNGSYYTPRTSCASITLDGIAGAYSLIGKGDIKNYEGEIEKFFEYIMPWVDAQEGEFIGYSRYEEELLPRLVLKTRE